MNGINLNPADGIFYALFLAVFAAGMAILFYRLRGKWQILRRAPAENRFGNWRVRIGKTVLHFCAQRRILADPATGLMHAMIFWGFCVLAIHTTSLFSGTLVPALAFEELLGAFYAWPKDLVILLVTVAVLYAAFRRAILRPARVESSGEAYLVLFLIFLLMATDVALEATRYSAGQTVHGFLGMRAAPLLHGWTPGALTVFFHLNWWVHVLVLLFFLNFLPGSKHFHVITSLPNVFFQKLDPPARLQKLDLEDETAETFGVSKAGQLDWKWVLDLYSCTECGRCHEFCPTHATGKPLSPKRMNDHLKAFIYRHEKALATGQAGELPDLFQAEAVKDDEVWACTTCGFCESACPLFIEQVPWITGFRRHLTLTESRFPEELTKTFKGLENNSNPWGIGAHKRGDWAKDLNVQLAGDGGGFEYLYYVGCSGSFDDRNKRVSTAFVKLLQKAGVSFAILGEAEGCCGDAARRTGNEYLFQILAQANIETFKEAGVKKIITTCPHGYNTLKHEYGDFGGHYEVYHHSEFLEKLLREGKLKPNKPFRQDVAFHDSCYLGRGNGIYAEPRNLLRRIEGVRLQELELHHEKGFCCGGGGGRIFMEENLGTRINHTRIEQVQKSGCNTVAAACPFCMTMLTDGAAEKNVTGVQVRDIAEILLEAVGE